MLALAKPVRYVGVDVDLAEDVIAPPDQHDELRFGERITGEVIPDRVYVPDVLIAFLHHRGATHTLPHRNPRVLGLTACEPGAFELIAVQHVRVDGRIRRPARAYRVAGQLEQRRASVVAQLRDA